MVAVPGGLAVSMLAIGPKIRGFRPEQGLLISKGDKTLQYSLLRRRNKGGVSMCKVLGMLKNPSK
jgi:hypothetical protein